MITQKQAKYLLDLPKELENNNNEIDLAAERTKLILVSPDDDEWNFLFQIYSNRKISFRISLHNQENISNMGLLRIDYKNSHINPETINSYVPKFLYKYVGKRFINESHIHFHVEKYRSLAWAMPLKDFNKFNNVKKITSNLNYANAIKLFAKMINLKSNLKMQNAIKL